MRDYTTAGKRPRAATMRRCGTIDRDPIPTPRPTQEQPVRANIMAHCLFGCPMYALGLTEVTVNDA